jgi:uridine kinase
MQKGNSVPSTHLSSSKNPTLTVISPHRGAKNEPMPYIIGICGGPSSGKSTVARSIKSKLEPKCSAVILNLINFYKPIRGNLRRRSRGNSMREDIETKNEEELKSEIRDVYRKNDFDSPEAIDWQLLNKGVQALKNLQPFNKPIYDDETMMR